MDYIISNYDLLNILTINIKESLEINVKLLSMFKTFINKQQPNN